jgi:hypothetical protein
MMKSKGTQTKLHYGQPVQENSSSASSANPSRTTPKSLWRMFSNDWLPTTSLSSHAGAIQISEL